MKFKIILLFVTIITALSIGYALEQSKINKDLLNPISHRLKHDVNAASFIPENHKQYIYLKDTPGIYKRAQESTFYNDFKNNNLLLDLKYNYGEDIDLFFTKFNMEFEDLLDYIKADMAFGFNDNGFFISASLTYKSKIITSVLNISKSISINSHLINDKKVYSINKESAKIYYVLIDEYILFSDSINTISSMIKSGEKGVLSYRDLDIDTLVYKRDINYNENPFDIFPLVKDMEVLYNIRTRELKFSSNPINSKDEYHARKDKNYHETLKLLSYDTPLVYYHSSYPLGEIITSLTTNVSSSFKNDLLKALGGVYFILDDIQPLLEDMDPSLAMIVNINPESRGVGEELVNLSQDILGLEWISETLENGIQFLSSNSFYMVAEDNVRYALFTDKSMAENYAFRLIQPTSSLYDRFDKHLEGEKGLLESYACINTKGITETSIDLIERYIKSSINMKNDEYDESFGPFIDYFKELGDGYVEFVYNREDKRFYGSLH